MTTLDEPRVGHPLEPLSGEEISTASAIVKGEKGLGATARFVFIALEELLAEVAKYGAAHVKRAYGDWTGTRLTGTAVPLVSVFSVLVSLPYGLRSSGSAGPRALGG